MSDTMTTTEIDNANITSQHLLMTPEKLKKLLPPTPESTNTITQSRQTVRKILEGRDHRLFIVVGPCSVHDTKAAKEYARRLWQLNEELKDSLYLIMRVYFEKPRTTTGWKGLINDPFLDDSFQIEKGLHIARELLLDITHLGLPTATEALDPVTPQYLHDLITWSAIGARTTESQTHREMASGLSSVIGFKNGTDGNLNVAINALQSVSHPHRFLGIDGKGQVAVTHTTGNPFAHIVLRGGNNNPNYDFVNIRLCEQSLRTAHIPENIMVDCSHANSNKEPELQPLVVSNIADQINEGNQSIKSLMLESNLHWGNQAMADSPEKLAYGISVTDACIDWKTTESCLRQLHDSVKDTLKTRQIKKEKE
ncbi:Phospho-2-dehydro-3-deoxyheptonate aldolase, Tyr-sensitive [invertebrate metagenome]|uniref:3-deoxy-7-phosphoheptulonate synthase n=1 Tax=invertebrate metagenome TaxID=1711999 RepID=A0A2H9T465_9ZZZZ